MAVGNLLIFSILHLLAIFFIQYCEFIFESFGDGDFFFWWLKRPFYLPRTKQAVERPSESKPLSLTTVTEIRLLSAG